MTFFSQKEAEYKQFRKDVIDRIESETSWNTLVNYSTSQDADGNTGYAAWDPGPDSTDLIWLGTEVNNQNDRAGKTLDLRTGSKSEGLDSNNQPANRWARQHSDLRYRNNTPNATDTVRYWMSVTDTGFAIASERVESDGNDEAVCVFVSKIDRAWDYTQASAVDSTFSMGRHTSSDGDGSGDIRNGSNTSGGMGIRNPDQNFDNYPRSSRLIYSNNYRNSNNNRTLIGTTDRVLRDRSKSDVATGDTVQDSDGSNVYMLFSFEKTQNFALKMV